MGAGLGCAGLGLVGWRNWEGETLTFTLSERLAAPNVCQSPASREKKGGNRVLRSEQHTQLGGAQSEQHTQLGGAQTGEKQALINR